MTDNPTPTPGLMSALLAVQKEAPKLVKDSEAQAGSFSYKYVDLAAVMETVGPLLTKHGLVWSTFPTRDEQGHPALRYKLTHAATGECEQDTMPLMLAKADAQGQGSAITYARRYSITAVLNLVADADDDGNAASRRDNSAAATSNGEPKLATKDDVEEMVTAAKGLHGHQVKLALAACGVTGVTAYNNVPAEKVVPLVKALAGTEREA